MLRFVHLADVHLDTPFRSRDRELRLELAEAGREAFRRAIQLTIDEEAQALVIAGDLFDNDRLSVQTEVLLRDSFLRLADAGIIVVLATGNHDPGAEDLGAYRRADDWPDTVFLARGSDPIEVVVQDASGRDRGIIAAVGHASAQESENLARRFRQPKSGLPSVAVLHTQVESARAAANHQRYAPCSLGDLMAQSFDYWALGHVHVRQELCESPMVHYSGNLQGRHFGETGAKGALVIEIDAAGARPRVVFRELAPIRWDRLRLDGLETVDRPQALIDRAAQAYDLMRDEVSSRAGRRDDVRHLLRIELVGPCPLARVFAMPEEAQALGELVRDELDALFVEWETTQLRLPHDFAALRERSRILDGVFALVEELRNGRVAWSELGLGPLASHCDSGDAKSREEILNGLEELLAEAMTDETTS